MKAIFEELVINKTSTIGGKEIISPAGGVVAHKVEEVTVTYNNVSQKAYRCYFLAEQDGDEVDNDFAVNDQVRSESFNVRKGTYHKDGNHFYWRLVIGRDEDPVELEGRSIIISTSPIPIALRQATYLLKVMCSTSAVIEPM